MVKADTDKIVELPNRDHIEAEACAWIAQLDGDKTPSAEDLAALREWIGRSPVHQQELQRLAALWGDLNQLTDLAPALNSLESQHPQQSLGSLLKQRLKQLLTPRKPMAPALGLLAMLSLGLLLWNDYQIEPLQRLYTTEIGQQQRAQLPDGSVLHINTGSRVAVDFDRHKRTVQLLQGEAHFEVAHDKSRPFEVFAGAGMVRAVGTAFSVHLLDQQVEVTVTEGRVELASQIPTQPQGNEQTATSTQPLELTQLAAGQNTSFNHSVKPIKTLRHDQLARKLSWRDGMLVFSGESLESVIKEVSRYTTQTIVITDPAIRDVRIGGYFKAGETQAIMEVLALSFGIKVQHINKNLIHLSKASPAG